ncbi:oxidoreductase [Cohnella pontilimi]|uniref:Oxidoreductase n=1 Tax=Cohnella pontilimi TaxID=2564100 RepID=A0A4U0F8G7_9BACL|nr:NAD(P)/FAD-dependent oxidoreductase [Cohnella pontilimi]TJY40830.1 oxidoreductase [Cohnella pontilimi]
MREVDVLVIGAGQAGLAMGYYLKQHNKSFVILGKEDRAGEAWRKRYDSLVLFTPRWFSGLPGLPLKGNRNGYAAKDEIADYLENYMQFHQLPVELQTAVYSLEQHGNMYVAATSRGDYRAKKVVVATGPFHKPFVPEMAKAVSPEVYQVHTSQYRNSSQLKPGSVLVVGGGNSGAQIAVELSQDREVYLSIGYPLKFYPLQKLGMSIFWWFKKLGMLKADVESRMGGWMKKQNDPIFGLELRELLRQGKIGLKSRTADMFDKTVTFKGDVYFLKVTHDLKGSISPVSVDNIVWATGFRSNYSWIRVPYVIDGNGKPIHQRGVTAVDGLYFIGLPWQQTRGSALLGGVGKDAKWLAERM